MELRFWLVDADTLLMPRGFIRRATWILRDAGIEYQLDNQTRKLPQVNFRFTGRLKNFQADAVSAVLRLDFGILLTPT
ncbi:MAG: hypothetical protein WC405_20690, partial [Syntrophales bacterium]